MNLCKELRKKQNLFNAWKHVKEKGQKSLSSEIQKEVNLFEEKAPLKLDNLYKKLNDKSFTFAPQIATLKKRNKKSPRPIVIAPIQNRIIQRAILEVLQNKVPQVQEILNIPTSYGGIKGTQQAIEHIIEAIQGGAKYYVRSDIQNFFPNIPKQKIVQFLKTVIDDEDFINLFEDAVRTIIQNSSELGENIKYFPIDEETGVAQGSALSVLMGNILLKDFDQKMTDRGITCIRYIDDFVILGPNRKKVRKAFDSAKNELASLGLTTYAPEDNPEKASDGPIENGFEFLGCHINNIDIAPTNKATQKLLYRVDLELKQSLRFIRDVIKSKNLNSSTRGLVQTLRKVDKILKGWDDSFGFCTDTNYKNSLNRTIDEKIKNYKIKISKITKNPSPYTARKALGVHWFTTTQKQNASS